VIITNPVIQILKEIEKGTIIIDDLVMKFLLTAISVGENNNPAHFDCVLKQVSENEELGPKEKIIYIGNGNFAVINNKSGKELSIRKTIQFELKENNSEWRKKLSRNLKNR
jgi:hypothetical protein